MAWDNSKNWSPGEPIPSLELNQYRDNFDWLFNRPSALQRVDEASNYTTTSTTFVDVDSTDLSKTLNIVSGRALVVFVASAANNAAGGGDTYFDIDVDGTRQGLDDGLSMAAAPNDADPALAVVVCPVMNLSQGNHTFKVQWKRGSSGTSTLFAGAGTSGRDLHPIFFVLEF